MSDATMAKSLGNRELFELWLIRNTPLAAVMLDTEKDREQLEIVFGLDLDELERGGRPR